MDPDAERPRQRSAGPSSPDGLPEDSEQGARHQRHQEQQADAREGDQLDQRPALDRLVSRIDIRDAIERRDQRAQNAPAGQHPEDNDRQTDLSAGGDGGRDDRIDINDAGRENALHHGRQPGRDDGWGDNVADHSGAGEEQREEGKDAVAGQRGGPFHRLSRPDVTDGLPQDVDGGRKRSGTTHEELLQWSTEARDVTAPRLACD